MSFDDLRTLRNCRRTGTRAFGICLLLTTVLCGLASPPALAVEARSADSGFVPGDRELFSIDFSQVPLGEFPASLRNLRGSMEVVEKDGKPMLRASDNAEFLVSLPERLPEHFTLEFDLITRIDYNTEEIAFEGTPTFNRGPGSANVLFYRTDVSVLGGREAGHAYIKIPADIAAELQGQPAEFRVDVNGTTVTLYANGRLISSVADVNFARSRVLRVFLGGHDTDLNAVHLSRVRIAGASVATPVVAQQPSTPTGAQVDTTTLPTATAPAPAPTAPSTIAPAAPAPSTTQPPAILQRASTGPGTQTEDDVYVGNRRQVEGVTSPLTTTPQVPSGAGTSPNTGDTTSRTSVISSGGGDGDLDDLEVERRTVEGITGPLTTTPQVPSGTGTSPNTGDTTSRASTISSGGGDGDLDDLEVERRTVQGTTSPLTTAPQPPPGSGPSPDTGSSVAPAPGTPLP